MIHLSDGSHEMARQIKNVYSMYSKIHGLSDLTEVAARVLKVKESEILDLLWDKRFDDPCHCANLVCAVGIAMTYLNAFYTSISYSEKHRVYRIESENGEFIEIPFGLFQMNNEDIFKTENNVIIKGLINDNPDSDEESMFRRLTFKSLNTLFDIFNQDINKIQSRADSIIASIFSLPNWISISQTGRNVEATKVTNRILWYNFITSRCDFLTNQSFIPNIGEFREI